MMDQNVFLDGLFAIALTCWIALLFMAVVNAHSGCAIRHFFFRGKFEVWESRNGTKMRALRCHRCGKRYDIRPVIIDVQEGILTGEEDSD